MEALKERYLRHVQPVARHRGERTVQLSVIRKDSSEVLHQDFVTTTIKEGEEEAAHTAPGMGMVPFITPSHTHRLSKPPHTLQR